MENSISTPTANFPSKIILPPIGYDSWRAGAIGLLAVMTPEGQQRALASWATISERAGGPFTPKLPTPPPAPVVVPEAGLLDDFTVLDLEFQNPGGILLEVAAIRYINWQPVDEYVSFVRFRGELNFHVAKLTGIMRDDVWNAPEEREALIGFKTLIRPREETGLKPSVLVCHNYSADQRILEAARARLGATTPLVNQWLCTMALAKLRLPKGEQYGLGALCTTFGINALGAHRARRDVEMCYQVLRRLHEQQPVTELVTSSAKAKPKQTSLFA
jgi:DNA polymerase III epsilon subunit-like protein